MLAHCLLDQLQRIAADLRHDRCAVQAVAIRPVDAQRQLHAADIVQGEFFVEQADKRANRTAGVVVLGLAQEESGTAFKVAQINVVAERGADDAPA